MPDGEFRILAINPGSTSTKFAWYVNEHAEVVKNIRHTDAEMAQFRGRPILEQQQFRCAQMEAALAEAGRDLGGRFIDDQGAAGGDGNGAGADGARAADHKAAVAHREAAGERGVRHGQVGGS